MLKWWPASYLLYWIQHKGLFPWALWLFCFTLLIDTVLLSTWLYCLMTEVICCVWHMLDNELTTFMKMALLECPLFLVSLFLHARSTLRVTSASYLSLGLLLEGS